MILTDRFTFVHVPKAGGSFVGSVLRKVKGLRVCPIPRYAHLPLASAPASLPAFAFVRDPAGWYASWHDHCARLPDGDPIYDVLSDHRRLDANETISNAAAPTRAILDEIVGRLGHQRRHHFHMPVDRGLVREWEGLGQPGLYTLIVAKMLTRNFARYCEGEAPDRSGLELFDFADLRPALVHWLTRHGVAEAEYLCDERVSPPVNVDRAPVTISKAVLALIADRDSSVARLRRWLA